LAASTFALVSIAALLSGTTLRFEVDFRLCLAESLHSSKSRPRADEFPGTLDQTALPAGKQLAKGIWKRRKTGSAPSRGTGEAGELGHRKAELLLSTRRAWD